MAFSFKTLFTRKRETSSTSTLVEAIKESAAGISQAASSRVSVDEHTALNVPTYLRCLNVIAQHIAVLPFRYMWKKGDVYEEKENDPMHYLLSIQMQSNLSNYQWFYQLAFRTVHYGETLVYPRIVMGEVVEFVLIEQDCWSHDKVNNIYYISDINNGVSGDFPEQDVLHFIWNSIDGKEGFPMWKLIKPALDILATGDCETQKRFESGGNVMGIISNNIQQGGTGVGQYKTQSLENVAETLQTQFRSGNRIAAVGGDARFSPISSSSADMQFSEQLKRATLEVCRGCGVPSYKVYVETSGTQYNTPEISDKALFTETIQSMAVMIEREFQRKMVSRSLCHKRVFKFDRDAIYSLDLKSKADYYQKMQQVGAWSVNDVRLKENMPKVANGDKIYVSTNMAELGSQKLAGQTSPDSSQGGENEPTKEPESNDGKPEPTEEPKPKRERDERGRFIKR